MNRIKVGSIIVVRGQKGTVVNIEEDVKNGNPGVDYVPLGSELMYKEQGICSWCYLSQIQSVVKV